MGYTNTQEVTLHYNRELQCSVTYYYHYEAGVHTLSNGDPGYPEESEMEIQEVEDCEGNNLMPLLDRMDNIFRGKEGYSSPYTTILDSINPEAPEDDFEPDIDDYCEFDHLIP